MNCARWFDFEKDIITERFENGFTVNGDGSVIRLIWGYSSGTYYWSEEGILETLETLPDEVLKMLMMQQPILAELIGEVLQERVVKP